MSKLTTMQEISHLLVKIHKGQQEIQQTRSKLDVLLNIQNFLQAEQTASINFENGAPDYSKLMRLAGCFPKVDILF